MTVMCGAPPPPSRTSPDTANKGRARETSLGLLYELLEGSIASELPGRGAIGDLGESGGDGHSNRKVRGPHRSRGSMDHDAHPERVSRQNFTESKKAQIVFSRTKKLIGRSYRDDHSILLNSLGRASPSPSQVSFFLPLGHVCC